MSSVLLLVSYFLTLYTLAFWGFEEERIGEPGTTYHHLAFKNQVLNRYKTEELLLDLFFTSEVLFMFVTTREDEDFNEVDQVS